jgi:hypothetical protein
MWPWALPTTPVNVAEYDWTVQLRNEDRDFTFGFLYFKPPGANPGRGSFQDLLGVGQASVALISSNNASVIDSAIVEAAAQRDTLWIRVRQRQTLTGSISIGVETTWGEASGPQTRTLIYSPPSPGRGGSMRSGRRGA